MNTIFRCSIFLLYLFAVSPLHAWAGDEPQLLRDITFGGPSSSEEQITFQLNGTLLPKIFAIKGEKPRLVFDFPNTKAAAVLNNIIDTNGNLIKKIRTGIHEGDKPKTRVVLDLTPDIELGFTKKFNEQTKSLLVSVQPVRGSQPVQKTGEPPATAPRQLTTKPMGQAPTGPPQVDRISKAPKKTPPPPKPEVIKQPETPAVQATTDQKGAGEAKTDEIVKDQPPILESIKFDAGSNKGEMILFKLNDFYPPIVFGLEESLPRVVCDFMNTTAAQEVPNVIECDGKFVKTIRVGRHSNPNKVRVVLDLVPNKNYDLQQVFFKEDNLFVIIVNTLTEGGEKSGS